MEQEVDIQSQALSNFERIRVVEDGSSDIVE
jgi:hypothetical protein